MSCSPNSVSYFMLNITVLHCRGGVYVTGWSINLVSLSSNDNRDCYVGDKG
jgi:hypothetical protein